MRISGENSRGLRRNTVSKWFGWPSEGDTPMIRQPEWSPDGRREPTNHPKPLEAHHVQHRQCFWHRRLSPTPPVQCSGIPPETTAAAISCRLPVRRALLASYQPWSRSALSPRWNEFFMRVPAQPLMKTGWCRRKLLLPRGPEVIGLNGAVSSPRMSLTRTLSGTTHCRPLY